MALVSNESQMFNFTQVRVQLAQSISNKSQYRTDHNFCQTRMIVAASRNQQIQYFCPFCIFVTFYDLSQPAGNCFDDFNGCRTAYIALLVQLVCNICGQIGGSNNMAL